MSYNPNYPPGGYNPNAPQPGAQQYNQQPAQQYNQGFPGPQNAQPAPMQYNQAPAGGMAPPPCYLPDDKATAELYRQHAVESASMGPGGGAQYVKWPGPGGAPWDANVRAPFESTVTVRIAPAFGPTHNFFVASTTHFWKSNRKPRGASMNCPGPATCLICQAREAAMAASGGDPAAQTRIKDMARPRHQYLYNVILVENYQGHFGKDGVMRPFILSAGAGLHRAIGDIIEGRGGASQVIPYQMGRPLKIKRKKTGPYPMDIDYSVLDMDPIPLDQAFWPALSNLWDLTELTKAPDQATMLAAVQDLGLSVAPPGPGGALW